MTQYQEPLSPALRQMVTCRAPIRILCAGLDMMFVSFIWFPAPLIGALRERPHRRIDGLLPTGASCDTYPWQHEKRKVHALKKNQLCESRLSGCCGRLRL